MKLMQKKEKEELGVNEISELFNVKKYTVYKIMDGYQQLSISQISKLITQYNVSADDILSIKPIQESVIIEGKRMANDEIPAKLSIDGVDVLHEESWNALRNHIIRKGRLWPETDEFIRFLEYLIIEENFIQNLSKIEIEIQDEIKKDIQDKKISQQEISKFLCANNYNDALKALDESIELKNKYKILIKDRKFRETVRDIIIKYLYENLKK